MKGFQDVLAHKVTTSTSLSSAAIHDVANKNRVLDNVRLMFFSEKYNKYIDRLDVALVKNGIKVSVEVKFYNAIIKKVLYKLVIFIFLSQCFLVLSFERARQKSIRQKVSDLI